MTTAAQIKMVAAIKMHQNRMYKNPVLSVRQDTDGNYFLVGWGNDYAPAYLRKDWNSLPLWAQVWYLQCLRAEEEERITLTFGKGTTRISLRQSELEDCKVFYKSTEGGLYVTAQGQNFQWVGRWLSPLEKCGNIPDGYREVTTTQGIGTTAQLFGTKSGAGEKHSLKWGVITALFGRSDITEIHNIEGCFKEKMVGDCLPTSKELASYFS